jgi:hypothetical protein
MWVQTRTKNCKARLLQEAIGHIGWIIQAIDLRHDEDTETKHKQKPHAITAIGLAKTVHLPHLPVNQVAIVLRPYFASTRPASHLGSDHHADQTLASCLVSANDEQRAHVLSWPWVTSHITFWREHSVTQVPF